jgi:hypothetical protein
VAPPDSELRAFLDEADLLVQREPRVLELIDQDLDRHGRLKKAFRVQDAQWMAARSRSIPTVVLEPAAVEPDRQRLEVGRPRSPADVVYMFLVGRGFYGGFKSSEATTLLQESTTLAVFLTNHGSEADHYLPAPDRGVLAPARLYRDERRQLLEATS